MLTVFRLPHFSGDLIAGLTVGLTVIPQGLAYAVIAELPPQVREIERERERERKRKTETQREIKRERKRSR